MNIEMVSYAIAATIVLWVFGGLGLSLYRKYRKTEWVVLVRVHLKSGSTVESVRKFDHQNAAVECAADITDLSEYGFYRGFSNYLSNPTDGPYYLTITGDDDICKVVSSEIASIEILTYEE